MRRASCHGFLMCEPFGDESCAKLETFAPEGCIQGYASLPMNNAATAHPWLSSQRDFRTTHWSVIARAGVAEGDEAAAALSALCRIYWLPLHAFVRWRGHDEEEAKDLTQSFFAKLLEHNYVGSVRAERGRFRTFLLTAMTNFLANDWRHSQRLKRGGGQTSLSLDEARDDGSHEAVHQPVSEESPERDYDRQWVHALLARVLERLRGETQATGREKAFAVLKQFLVGDRGALSYADAARSLSMTESAAKAAIHRLRLRYGEIFREEVARTVADESEIEGEIRHLLSVMS